MLESKVKNTQRWYFLGRTSRRFLCCSFLTLCIFICQCFILLLYLHLISRLLYHVTGIAPWHLRPVKASTSSELYPDSFWLPFLFDVPEGLWFWLGVFYPQAYFTLCSFHKFWHNLLLSRLPWEPAVIPWNLQGFILILETQTRPICLIHSNPQSFIHLKFVFKHVNIAKVLRLVKTLIIRSAATLFSSHENIKQQSK